MLFRRIGKSTYDFVGPDSLANLSSSVGPHLSLWDALSDWFYCIILYYQWTQGRRYLLESCFSVQRRLLVGLFCIFINLFFVQWDLVGRH